MIEKFKNIHENEDIYIIASGKSLDFFNPNFVDNKISIGINQIYKKIKTNYLVLKDLPLLGKTIQDIKENQILFASKGNFGESNELNKNFIKKNHPNKNIFIFDHEKNNHKIEQLPKNSDYLVVSHSTITSGIHLAAYMGAKNIILVGHDCGSINKETNCSSYHTDETYKIAWSNSNQYKKWLKTIEKDTIKLRELLNKKYNCNMYSLNPFINLGLEGNTYEKSTMKVFI